MPQTNPPFTKAAGASILVADDDPMSRDMLALMLTSSGFEVECAEDGQDALERAARRTERPFEVLFTDVQMPRMDGLQLLARINAEFPAVATVMVTGSRERELVSASLRGGAVEFLDKPFDMRSVLRAAQRGCEMHASRRQQIEASLRLREIANIQRRLNRDGLLDEPGFPARLSLRTSFHALHEAGGDLVKVVVLPPDRVLLVLGDVSGHGIKEGFLAAYFQGVIQGMGRRAAGATEIAEAFNAFLQTRWNEQGSLALNASLSATFVELDLSNRHFSVLDCGGTGARLVNPDGSLRQFTAGGCPLGWFESLEASRHSVPLPERGQCWLWSDGLDEHAQKHKVSPLILAWRLLLSRPDGPLDAILQDAQDDIVVSRLDWAPPGDDPIPPAWSLLLQETYSGDEARIDALHENWSRLLYFALPECASGCVHDIALCTREAVINALEHGCRRDPARRVQLEFALNGTTDRLRVRVTDDGAGFNIDCPPPPQDPEHISLGLKLIRSLALSARHTEGGRVFEIVMPLRFIS